MQAGISPNACVLETILNDYEMMFECGESFAMANAHEDLKKAAKHIAPSNDENGVMKSIQKWFGL